MKAQTAFDDNLYSKKLLFLNASVSRKKEKKKEKKNKKKNK